MSYAVAPSPETEPTPSEPVTGVGFILTRHVREFSGATFIELWLRTDSGAVKLLSPAQKDIFFIRLIDASSAQDLLRSTAITFDYKQLDLHTFQQEPVGGLYFSKKSASFAARNTLTSHCIPYFEGDIQLSDRFLMERFVYGSAEFYGLKTKQNASRWPSLSSAHNAQLKPSRYKPEFKVLSLDIECSEHGALYSIGLAAKDYQCVVMIGTQQADAPNWVRWVDNERLLLLALIDEVSQYDPDIFIGWSVVNFDFRLLIKRAQRWHVRLTLGRDDAPIGWREPRNERSQGYVVITGRVIVDGIDALKTATYQFDSYSLEHVSQHLLGKGKLSDDVDNRMEAINHDFHHNKIKLAEYNLQDCTLVLDIFEHTRMLDFLVMRSQLTGLALDRSGGSVAAFVNVYLPKLHRAGYIAPNRPGDGGLASPGGYVMNSLPGLYNNVLVLDFKSLYPSIIRTFKIDPWGLVEGLKAPNDAIPGYRGASFSRQKHFLPDIVESMWKERDLAKQQNDLARSQAIKILMNSFYGVLGSGGCPFYDTRLASSITMRGHDIMQTTAQWIESSGYTVIYGDTDSLFIWLGDDCSVNAAQQIGNDLQQTINDRWTREINEKYALNNEMEIEFETHFLRFLMPTIRGSDKGSKKRYAGVIEKCGEKKIVFKGLENVRSDWTAISKQFQHDLYTLVFSDKDVETYILDTVQAIRAGRYDDQLIYRKRLRRKLRDYVKNVPPHVKAARIADRKNDAAGKPKKYQNRGWISYVITVNGPEPLEYRDSAIDYEHYIDKQIQPIAEGILPFIGLSFESIVRSQLGLF